MVGREHGREVVYPPWYREGYIPTMVPGVHYPPWCPGTLPTMGEPRVLHPPWENRGTTPTMVQRLYTHHGTEAIHPPWYRGYIPTMVQGYIPTMVGRLTYPPW